MATTNGINYNQIRGLVLSTNGKNRVIVSTGGTTTFTGDTNGGTVLSVSGTNGGLFSVVDTNTGTLLEVLDNSNNPIFQVGTVDKIKISGLTSATDPNVLTIDSSGIVHTIPTSSLGGGGGLTWNNATTSITATTNNGYVGTATTLTTITLPTGATFGSTIEVVGTGTGLWRISQNENQFINFGIAGTTTGTTGYLSATSQYDCVKLLCTSANTAFVVTSAIGNIFYI
jgi:hypothetical protein